MSEPVEKQTGGPPPPKPPRGCHIFLGVCLLLVILIVFLCLKDFIFKPDETGGEPIRKKVIFWTLGGSETHGYGAAVSFSWPQQIAPYFERQYPPAGLSVIHSTIPDANTSEGLEVVKTFLAKYRKGKQEAANPALIQRPPDFALICFGINNRWNLQSGTFANWPKEELNKASFRSALAALNVRNPVQLTRIPRKVFFKRWDEEGWDVFFNSFSDPFLSRWIRSDLTAMIDLIRGSGIEPVLLTYYYDRFPELNGLIRDIGTETKTTVLDLETPMQWFIENKMILYRDEEDPLDFQINSDGYNYVARLVVEQFSKFYSRDTILRKMR